MGLKQLEKRIRRLEKAFELYVLIATHRCVDPQHSDDRRHKMSTEHPTFIALDQLVNEMKEEG